MAQPLQDFQQAQIQASNYALQERKYKRQAVWYLLAAVVSAFITLIVAPKLVIPSLLFSAISYSAMRYGSTARLKVKQWWTNRQADKGRRTESVTLEPLLTPSNPHNLRAIANGELNHALQYKTSRIHYYEKLASNQENAPTTYYDYKHTRALSQFRMIQITQSAALDGKGDFIAWSAEERQERRMKKLEILKLLKREYIDTQKLSICLKHTNKSSEGKCQLAGDVSTQLELLKKLKELNQSGGTSLVTLPADPQLHHDALLKILLPLVLDMDNILHHVQAIGMARVVPTAHSRSMFLEQTYPISAEYLKTRIDSLEKVRVISDVVSESSSEDDKKSFELVV